MVKKGEEGGGIPARETGAGRGKNRKLRLATGGMKGKMLWVEVVGYFEL